MPIVALEYHDVVPDDAWDSSGFPGPAAASYKMAATAFQAHLDALPAPGRVVGATVGAALAQPAQAHVLLTFDDGGASATTIGQLLESRGWRAHLFMPTDRIGTPNFLGRSELVALHAAGHVIGSHSASHPMRMSHLAPGEMRAEWQRSVGMLSDILGAPVTVASVPGGYHSDAVADAAAEAGIRVLFTSEPVTTMGTVGACTVIGRFTLRQHHTPRYVRGLVGASPVGRASQWMQWNAKKVAKWAAGGAYLRAREALLGRR